MNLTDYLGLLRRFWISITVTTAAGLLLGLGVALVTPPTFTGQSAVFVSVRDGETAREVLGGASYATSQVRSYTAVALSPLVLQPVIDELKLTRSPELLIKDEIVTASVVSSTSIIALTADDPSPTFAADIAQAMAEELVVAVERLSPADPSGGRTVTATIITPAAVPIEASQPQLVQYAIVGLLVGVGLGLTQALLRGTFRPTRKN